MLLKISGIYDYRFNLLLKREIHGELFNIGKKPEIKKTTIFTGVKPNICTPYKHQTKHMYGICVFMSLNTKNRLSEGEN